MTAAVAFDAALRSAIVLGAGLLIVACLSRASAAFRHCVLAASIFGAVFVVPLTRIVPVWGVHVAASRAAAAPSSEAPIAASADRAGVPRSRGSDGPHAIPLTQSPPTSNWFAWMALVWGLGAAAAAGRLAAGLVRLRRIAARAERLTSGRAVATLAPLASRYGIRRPIVLLSGGSGGLLATWGIRRPRIVLPHRATEWTEDRLYVVLCHELAHIRRHDWLVQIAAQAASSLLWFNPLVWIARARLRVESERACDDLVLGAGAAARDYAAHLLDLARMSRQSGSAWMSAMPIAHVSTLERRIAAMLNPRINRAALSARAAAAIVFAIAALTVPAAALRAVQSGPLSGSIFDPTGGVLPGVEVTLQDSVGTAATATSNASGRFEFPIVPSGSYVLKASLRGFKTLTQEIELSRAGDWDRVITLQVGTLQETISVTASRMAGSPQPGGGVRAPVRVGGNIRAPRKLRDARPIYPPAMRAEGREGVVPIEAVIGTDGSVTFVRVVSAQVHPDFAIAAADAVRQWQFTPTLLNGVPVEVVMTVTVSFTLAD